jgi:[ribosomal protein S18]-alanine N-acetyltransferase
VDKGLNRGSFTIAVRRNCGKLCSPRRQRSLIEFSPATVPYAASGVARYNIGVPFAIRDFQPSDFETLWRIDQDCFPPGISYSRTELKIYIRRRRSFTLVAVSQAKQPMITSGPGQTTRDSSDVMPGNGKIAGFIVAESGARGIGHVITIDVTAAARRSGVGSLLLRATEDRLTKTGSPAVELETAVDNISALSFYKRHGYSVIRTFPRYYSNGVDALVLRKDLLR